MHEVPPEINVKLLDALNVQSNPIFAMADASAQQRYYSRGKRLPITQKGAYPNEWDTQ